ncbi:MAG TPA: ATP-binding cassette domain-containing protein [Caldimonas sp.]|nr:ATP-binding cassette domain-containing protein [Caldimonas sp.]
MAEATGPALLALHDASVRFGDVVAVRDASLEIRRGESVAIVGANGSGKTTLLRLLHGVLPHSGTRRVGAASAPQAMVFQRPFLLRLSVRRNLLVALRLGARMLDARARAARADEALARVGLQALAHRPARALSGGEQQRLALARSWSVRPALLFLDEPTANLDPSAKKEVESLLAGFIAEGVTIVMSTHNLGQAKRLATRIVYMDGGRIGADLPTEQFFAERLGGRADLFLKGDLSWSIE